MNNSDESTYSYSRTSSKNVQVYEKKKINKGINKKIYNSKSNKNRENFVA